MSSNKGRRIRTLKETMEQSAGGRLWREIRLLETTFHIFTGNYSDLRKLLELYRNPDFAVKLWIDKKQREFQKDVLGRLHNYLAATMTLVDHTRIFVRKTYQGTEFGEEYEVERSRVFASPLCQFIQGLRNYTLHRGLPITAADIRGKGSQLEAASITLNISRLRSWKGWKSTARRYLEQASDEEALEEIIGAHFKLVTSFYDWFGRRLKEVHAREFAEYESIRQELTELEGSIF